MANWKDILVKPENTVREAIKIIDEGALQICLVVDVQDKLLGTITDGDIRRAVLKDISLEESVTKVMRENYTVAHENETRENILSVMKKTKIHQIPLVNDHGVVVGVETIDELLKTPVRDNWVILMAGGVGDRLRPLTDTCPKPLLPVGEKPLLERTLETLIDSGFRNFYLSVNYKAEMIKEHFGDGSKWGVPIKYLTEDKKMGTAGALTLLPVLVINGDILTKVNYQQLLTFHEEQGSKATMCVSPYEFQVPFGVVSANDEHHFQDIEEKPVHKSLINAGIYVLNPDSVGLIPKNTFVDMPTLFKKASDNNMKTAVFPIREYWLDIGHHKDLDRAHNDIKRVFTKAI